MKFPWDKYEELPLQKRNTLQVFVTDNCNLGCPGCFVRNAIVTGKSYMKLDKYHAVILEACDKGAKQINILGGEPLMHNKIDSMCIINSKLDLKTTIYTNGLFLGMFKPQHFIGAKLRVSVDGYITGSKPFVRVQPALETFDGAFDINYMVSAETNIGDLIQVSRRSEDLGCKTFFISSYRYLDNNDDFFINLADFAKTMQLLKYKQLVHRFLQENICRMDIHISKRGVFESTKSLPHNKCKFANYFIGGKIIQCPYDVANLKWQDSYEFDQRPCQQNNTCLMSKIILRRL